jgi:TonB family protein
MAQSSGQTGTADPIAAEYFTWESSGGDFGAHIHLDAVDGLARDVIERSQGLPVEAGGLLLGHATRGTRRTVWIERYSRVECEHRSGPHFVLSEDELAGLEGKAAELAGAAGNLNVVGFYRSHLREGFGLDAPDLALIARYFKDPEDVFLLIGPVEGAADASELRAQFFTHGADGEVRAAEPEFPFRGRIVRNDDPRERTGRSIAAVPSPPGERLGRLVPDFIPAAALAGSELRAEKDLPAREFFMDHRAPDPHSQTQEFEHSRGFFARRWPLLAAIVLVGAGAGVVLQQTGHRSAPSSAPAADSAAVRPLGLYVDPSAASWRISWNPSATALQGARSVRLFVRDGEDEQTNQELSPDDLKSGTYRYQAKGSDVTFRLEATDANGQVSAESFRLLKSPAAASPGPEAPPPDLTRPKAVHKVAPVVPASIRPRIHGTIPVDVRVKIDAQGRVVSAIPATRAHSSLETFLEARAVAAAKQWRFEPAREGGKAVPGSEIIHFTFDK